MITQGPFGLAALASPPVPTLEARSPEPVCASPKSAIAALSPVSEAADCPPAGAAGPLRTDLHIRQRSLPWVDAYPVVAPTINADGVSSYPFADSAFPVQVGFHVYTARRDVRSRRHEHPELIYIYSGGADLQIQNRSFHVRQGDLIVLGPNLYHRILADPNQPAAKVKIISLTFQPEVIRGAESSGDAELYLLPLLCQDSSFPHVIHPPSRLPGRVLELILEIHNDLPAYGDLARLAVKTDLKMLLFWLVRHYRQYVRREYGLRRRERDLARLQPLFRLLDQKYGEHIKLADAARRCAMSSSYFMRFFKTVTGESFRAYLNDFRITKAQSLLATTSDPIGDIGERVGFCSQSYFGKVFLLRVGMTPLAYRRACERQNHDGSARP
jgi:AraC-like DNA-binding protein/mannose-6-phosphate isomerase-like protein (cupin superfamily)